MLKFFVKAALASRIWVLCIIVPILLFLISVFSFSDAQLNFFLRENNVISHNITVIKETQTTLLDSQGNVLPENRRHFDDLGELIDELQLQKESLQSFDADEYLQKTKVIFESGSKYLVDGEKL